jgi:hypothetical protein
VHQQQRCASGCQATRQIGQFSGLLRVLQAYEDPLGLVHDHPPFELACPLQAAVALPIEDAVWLIQRDLILGAVHQ